MSDFILDYDVLEDIAKYSDSLGRRAGEYGESLERKIIGAIDGVTGPSSGYLLNASDCVRDKINALNIKSKEFYQFSAQIKKLLEVAEQMDQEVADAIMAQREYFLDHHESLRIEDWKAKLQGLLVELKNSIPLLEVIADVLEGLDTIFESLKDSIKHWYECEGGKYIIDVVKSVGGVALAVGFLALAIGALALPTAGIFAICGVIGAGIAVVNSVTNVATSFRAADAALDGDPAWARIYGKQDKLSDVLRQTNFGNGTFNQLSNFSAGAIDATEVICDVVGVAEMGKSVVKLFQGDAFKLLKNKGGISYSDLKNGVKNGIVDLKSTIKQSYKDLKYGINGNMNKNSLLGDMSAVDLNQQNKYLDEVADGIKGGEYSNLGNMSFEDGKKYSSWSVLREEGLSYEQVEKIKVTPKGQKPTPETYLSEEYINNHLKSFKESGAVKIMPSEPSGTIGGKGGTFVMSSDELNEIIKHANGDVSKVESALGLDPGYLGGNPVIVLIDDTSSIRIPSGNELGAWPEYWEPGGYTSGGIKEAVINPALEGTYTYKHLFE